MNRLPQVQVIIITVSYSADIIQYTYETWKKSQHCRDRFGVKPRKLNKIKLREISALPEQKKLESVEEKGVIEQINRAMKIKEGTLGSLGGSTIERSF